MYAKAEGFQVEDEYDFLPHHDAPEISFEEAMQQYGGEQMCKNGSKNHIFQQAQVITYRLGCCTFEKIGLGF